MSMANDLEQLMLNLINQERSNANLAPLAFNNDLNAASEDHSSWMLDTDTFSHTGQGGSSAGDRIVAAGYQLEGNWTWGENIGWQSERGAPGLEDDVADIHQALMNSPGHRANILNPNFEEIGIGVERGDFDRFDSVMITQNFGATDAVSDDEDEAPVEEDTPVADVPVDDMPDGQETPAEDDPAEEETPVAETPEDDMPDDEEEETPVAETPDDTDDDDEDIPVADDGDDEDEETPVAEDDPDMDDPEGEEPPVAEGPEPDEPDAETPDEEPPVAEAPDEDAPEDDDETPVAEGPDGDDPMDEETPEDDPDGFDVEMFLAELSELLSDLFDSFDFVASDDCGQDDMTIDMPVDLPAEEEVIPVEETADDDMDSYCDAFEFDVSININLNFELG